MKNKKWLRTISYLLIVIFTMCMFTSCGTNTELESAKSEASNMGDSGGGDIISNIQKFARDMQTGITSFFSGFTPSPTETFEAQGGGDLISDIGSKLGDSIGGALSAFIVPCIIILVLILGILLIPKFIQRHNQIKADKARDERDEKRFEQQMQMQQAQLQQMQQMQNNYNINAQRFDQRNRRQ